MHDYPDAQPLNALDSETMSAPDVGEEVTVMDSVDADLISTGTEREKRDVPIVKISRKRKSKWDVGAPGPKAARDSVAELKRLSADIRRLADKDLKTIDTWSRLGEVAVGEVLEVGRIFPFFAKHVCFVVARGF